MKTALSLFLILAAAAVAAVAAPQDPQAKTGTLTGRIEDAKGKPLADIEVRAVNSRSRASKETVTDKDGTYRLELEPDHYTVSFDGEGIRGGTMTQMQQVEPGKETKVKTIRLSKEKRTSLVRGAVFGVDGYSLPAVKLKLERIPTEEEANEKKKVDSFKQDRISNSRGEFAFRVPAARARYRVTAMLSGYKPQTKVVDVNEDESVPLAFSLEAIKE